MNRNTEILKFFKLQKFNYSYYNIEIMEIIEKSL